MVVLAQPRDGDSRDVTLEEDDVIEYVLEKPFGEVLGCSLDTSSLQRSLSARVRRRERVCPDSTPPFPPLSSHKIHHKSGVSISNIQWDKIQNWDVTGQQ